MGLAVVAGDGDFLEAGAGGGWGGGEVVDEGEEVGLAAAAEVHEGDSEDAAGVGAVADGAEGAEGDFAGVDVEVDEGADGELGEVGQAEQAAVGAEFEELAGEGGVGFEAADGGLSAEAIARDQAVLRGSAVGGHCEFDSHA